MLTRGRNVRFCIVGLAEKLQYSLWDKIWNALLGETCSDICYLVVIFSLYKPLMLPLTELGIGCTGVFFLLVGEAFLFRATSTRWCLFITRKGKELCFTKLMLAFRLLLGRNGKLRYWGESILFFLKIKWMLSFFVLCSLCGWKLTVMLRSSELEEKGSGLEMKIELCWQNHEKIGPGTLNLRRPGRMYTARASCEIKARIATTFICQAQATLVELCRSLKVEEWEVS